MNAAHTNQELFNGLRAAHYVVSPNNIHELVGTLVYPAWGGAKRLFLRDILVTLDAIEVHRWVIGSLSTVVEMSFPTVAEYLAYVELNGRVIEAGPNVWD